MTYAEIKAYLGREDLVSLLQALGYEFTRQGSFSIREEKTPSTTIRLRDLYINDHGGDFSGDVFDLLKELHGMTPPEDKNYVMNFLGLSDDPSVVPLKRKVPTYTPVKKDNDLLQHKLDQRAKSYLDALVPKGTANLNRLTREKYSIVEVNGINTVRVAPVFEKLFEGYLIPADEKFAEYLFNSVIGYDSYYHCPVIILRDESERVVQYVRYRPERDGKPLMQGSKPLKYMYMKSEEKPDNSYLFPLQAQMQNMAKSQGYCYVGEGLKNAINASLMQVPFISIEGAGSIKPELISFLKSDRMKDIVLIGAFDGDPAGEQAYKRITRDMPMENEFTFDSGKDFAEYLKEIR